jgi:thiol-disulfide isomerase/thioredoxin
MSAAAKKMRAAVFVLVGLAAAGLLYGIVTHWPGGRSQQAAEARSETLAGPADTPSPVSEPRPDFTLPDLTGTSRAVKEWDGKVLAVNFWATWCGPCKEEIPLFNTLQKKYGPRGMQFVGVAMDDKASVQTYLKTHAIHYPVLVNGEDAAAELATRYGDDQGVVPYTAFVDRQGRIAFVQFGAMSDDLARQVIESLL